MAKKVKVTLNRSNVKKQLLQSQQMQNICNEIAYKAKSRLGDGYEVTYRKGKTRVNSSVAAVSQKAKKENSKHNTILKALGGAVND